MTATKRKGPRITGRAAKLILGSSSIAVLLATFTVAKILDPVSTVPMDSNVLERTTDLYGNPQPTRIDGYGDDCMEPFITGDGKYLLFNNSNSPFVDTHIHLCKRIGENHFQHLGILVGSVSKSKDMAPTIDAEGRLFYTCLLSYEKDGQSIYCGDFAGETLKNIAPANGDISPRKPGEINMDCDISSDGKTLVLSRAHFANPFLPPDKSDLAIVEKENGKFSLNPQGQSVLSKLNTSALEYAPCQTADQLELYFTRASKKAATVDAKKFDPYFRIMVARRNNRFSAYEEPERLEPLTGFIEAPTITKDKQEMFFHKKVDEKFRIFRAKRNVPP